MADQYVEVGKKSWGSNIMDSFVGLLVGILIFLVSFWVLWTNEGSVDLSKLAKQSVPVAVTVVDSAANGKFVSLSGKLAANERVSDPKYGQSGDYLKLVRQVEMYAWVEKTKSETKEEVGGGSTTKTTYDYVKQWTAHPKASTDLKHPEGHENPALTVAGETFIAANAKIGAYGVDLESLELPAAKPLPGLVKYVGSGNAQSPRVGDLKISYAALNNGLSVTAFGQIKGDQLVSSQGFYRALPGTREEAINALAAEHKTAVWTMRIVGFLMMWLGLFLFFGPLNAILKVLPFLGTAGRWFSGAITFPVALVLSAVTIIISLIAHNIWLLIAAIAIVGAGAVWLVTRNKK